MSLVSDCCGASPVGNGDNDLVDYGICSECREYCEYIEEEDKSISIDQYMNANPNLDDNS